MSKLFCTFTTKIFGEIDPYCKTYILPTFKCPLFVNLIVLSLSVDVYHQVEAITTTATTTTTIDDEFAEKCFFALCEKKTQITD